MITLAELTTKYGMSEEKAKAFLADNRKAAPTVTFKVSDKGGVSVYGLGRFPVTLYRTQWESLLAVAPALSDFITVNAGRLAVKD